MRVILVVSSYLPNFGGLQTVTSNLASELQKRGHSVTVLTQRYPRGLPLAEEIDGVRVRRLLFLIPRLCELQRGRLDLFLASLFYFPITLICLLWRIALEKPDVVNLHFVGTPALFLLIARTLIPFRFVVSLHGDDVEGLPRGTWLDRWVFDTTLCRADTVTACSKYLLHQVLRTAPSIASKAHVVYNGFDWRIAKIAMVQENVILGVGRMVPKKGFDLLVHAIAACKNCWRDLCLVLLGDGPEYNRLESLVCELGIDSKVRFYGAQSHSATIDAIESSRLVVIPSRQEPFGLVALEALAAGKPVVAARVGGLPEILDSADAVLVEPDNPAALAKGLTTVLARLGREPTFGARNREIAMQFSVGQMTNDFLDLYRGSVG